MGPLLSRSADYHYHPAVMIEPHENQRVLPTGVLHARTWAIPCATGVSRVEHIKKIHRRLGPGWYIFSFPSWFAPLPFPFLLTSGVLYRPNLDKKPPAPLSSFMFNFNSLEVEFPF